MCWSVYCQSLQDRLSQCVGQSCHSVVRSIYNQPGTRQTLTEHSNESGGLYMDRTLTVKLCLRMKIQLNQWAAAFACHTLFEGPRTGLPLATVAVSKVRARSRAAAAAGRRPRAPARPRAARARATRSRHAPGGGTRGGDGHPKRNDAHVPCTRGGVCGAARAGRGRARAGRGRGGRQPHCCTRAGACVRPPRARPARAATVARSRRWGPAEQLGAYLCGRTLPADRNMESRH